MLSSKNPYYADMYAYGELMWNNSPYLNLHAEAKNGYGPALYDIALMWAEKRGKWVVPSITANLLGTDRGRTTSEAENVWKFYYQSRPDVKKQDITEIVEKSAQSGSDPDDEEMFNKIKGKPWLLCAYKKKGAIHSIAPIWKPDNARDDYGVPLPGHQPPVTIRRKPKGVLKDYTF